MDIILKVMVLMPNYACVGLPLFEMIHRRIIAYIIKETISTNKDRIQVLYLPGNSNLQASL